MLMSDDELVLPGTSISFVPEGRARSVGGDVLEVTAERLVARLDAEGVLRPHTTTFGALSVSAAEGTVIVGAHTKPLGDAFVIVPSPQRPPERRAHPRVPLSSPVTVSIAGRLNSIVEAQFLDLSFGGCRVVRIRGTGAVLSRQSRVAIDAVLDDQPIRLHGVVVRVSREGHDVAYSIEFSEFDSGTAHVLESLIARRLTYLEEITSTRAPLAAAVEHDGRLTSTRFDPLDGGLDVGFPAGSEIRLRLRLPGVTPPLTLDGVVAGHDVSGRSLVRLSFRDAVTRALVERAALQRRRYLASGDAARA